MQSHFYYSENSKKDSIEIKHVVTALDIDNPPYYYIKIVTTYGNKLEWEYTSKQLRDKELIDLRNIRDKRPNQNT
jgi:hypothetical protein